MVFELIILRILALLLVFLILWWLGAVIWKSVSGNPKFDEFTKTVNQQPPCCKDSCCENSNKKSTNQNSSDESVV
jgi:hypothetical protein